MWQRGYHRGHGPTGRMPGRRSVERRAQRRGLATALEDNVLILRRILYLPALGSGFAHYWLTNLRASRPTLRTKGGEPAGSRSNRSEKTPHLNNVGGTGER